MIDIRRQVLQLVRPLATQVANLFARGKVLLVDDSTKMQLVQVGALAKETVEGAKGIEHFEPYGFTSVSLPPGEDGTGAEHVTMFQNGDRSHPITIVIADRRHRPTGSQPGEVSVYNHTGARITMTKDGDIEAQPAPGREVFIRDAGGSVDRLVKKSEHDGHTHGPGSFTTPSAGGGGGAVTGTSGGAAAVAGTQRLRVQ